MQEVLDHLEIRLVAAVVQMQPEGLEYLLEPVLAVEQVNLLRFLVHQ
jgi:hypothetical protein